MNATPKVSLCMIVRDEAPRIAACLQSIAPFVDEMVVVDTGSVDETPRIAAEQGAVVSTEAWRDDFSAARNASLERARGEWIFWMDADDTIDAANGHKLRTLADQPHDARLWGFVARVRFPDRQHLSREGGTVVDHVKLFRNRPEIRFEGRVHEQVLPAIRRNGGEIAHTDLVVDHSAYDDTPAGLQQKRIRDRRLLELDLSERPGHPFVLFNLGMTLADAGEPQQAVETLRACVAASHPDESHLRKAYSLLCKTLLVGGDTSAAWATNQTGLRLFPGDRELHYLEGLLLEAAGCWRDAETVYRQLLLAGPPTYFSSFDHGILGYLTRFRLATALQQLGDSEEADLLLRQVNQAAPRFFAAWQARCRGWLARGEAREADAVVEQLADAALTPLDAVLQAEVLDARGDVDAARHRLREAERQFPEDEDVRDAVARFLWERGPAEEAIAHWRQRVADGPQDAAQHHNLGVLLLREGRAAEATDSLQQAVRLRPAALQTRFYLAEALLACDRRAEAEEICDALAAADPASVWAARARQLPRPSSLSRDPVGRDAASSVAPPTER